jgi:phage recombination protein Bet
MNVQLPTTKIQSQEVASRFNAAQVDLIKRTICKGATNDELQLFMYQCERTGLDPFARQIYSIERREKRGDQWVTARSIQTSIDGFRLVAERSGKYAGQVGPYWCGEDGQWQDVWIGKDAPLAARVGVIRSDFKEPCWGVARFDSYAQKTRDGSPTRMWSVMADVMIAKCAEALALRKAFPQELSGLYTSDEMDQARAPEEPQEGKRQNPHVTRPVDVIEPIEYDEQGHPIDNIPLGDASIERLTKAQARGEYEKMQNEIRSTTTVAQLEEWGTTNANRTATLPVDWQEFMRDCYRGQLEHLRAAAKPRQAAE